MVLFDRNRSFLLGEQPSPDVRAAALQRLDQLPGVGKVTFLHLDYVGPAQVMLMADVDLVGEARESEVAAEVQHLENLLQRDPHVRRAVLSLSEPGVAPLRA